MTLIERLRSYLPRLRTAWLFCLSTFTRDICERCHREKLNVMFRVRYDAKLCDQCWVALKYNGIKGFVKPGRR